ncbi:hypothetical protein [Vibrio methylphosphonaticus]|uniref:hypothetical protein n=1 Tax=Vibrio methylphosphonaticus TaxID=2946866 RepID=UPI002029F572|nr:hypothetical protein [Vibrio methylphosphonaticus]MCL9774933.1 hypothetical protein [Vibrio methylphosphonaticus]
MPLSLQNAYDLMQSDLEEFLNRVPITISGAGSKVKAVQYYLSDTGYSSLGRVKGMPSNEVRRRFSTMNYGNTRGPVSCIHIPVTSFDKLTSDSFVRVNGYNTSNFLCTTQLSGCTFAVRKNKDGLEFTHIQPTDTVHGPQVQQHMAQSYEVSFGRGQVSDGTTYAAGTSVTIMGQRKNNLWEVFAQYQDSDKNVLGVVCIYKEPSSVAYVT